MSLQQSKAETEQFEGSAIIAALSWLCDPLWTMDNLQVGDVVQLKSGGPNMAIHLKHGDGTLLCQWFDKNGALQAGDLHPSQLKKAEPQEGRGSDYAVGQR